MTKLLIHPVGADPFTVSGKVTYSKEHNCYYCNGASYPAEIVKGVTVVGKKS